jgi:fructosamine-3-kinase
MLPDSLIFSIENKLSEKFSESNRITDIKPLSGGSINSAFKITTDIADFFVKYNHASRYPQMFYKESLGLSLLFNAREIDVPHIVLILGYIDSAIPKPNFWRVFGSKLAGLHHHTSDHFGLDHDNYIGSLPQSNKRHQDWISFFVEERLEKQVKMAVQQNLLSRAIVLGFEKLYKQLPEIFPVEPPSLIHGDLWSGNYMVGESGQPVIIDPAVYFGHREMDIGMSRLFGGFSQEFYDSYNEVYPLEKGWEERVEICNLYPLMVHVNLFGTGYVGAVQNILGRYTR